MKPAASTVNALSELLVSFFFGVVLPALHSPESMACHSVILRRCVMHCLVDLCLRLGQFNGWN